MCLNIDDESTDLQRLPKNSQQKMTIFKFLQSITMYFSNILLIFSRVGYKPWSNQQCKAPNQTVRKPLLRPLAPD